MTNNNSLQDQARNTIVEADFRLAWPVDVRKTLVKAAMTPGEMPPFAVGLVTRALRTAERIEKNLARDIEQGEANLTHAQRKALAKV